MKKIFKITLFLLCLFSVLGMNQSVLVKAETTSEDYVIGTHNYNNTQENSAVLGDRVLEPEVGWKRYDDCFGNIKYTGTGAVVCNAKSDGSTKSSDVGAYKDTRSYLTGDNNETITFNFVGSKIRLYGLVNWGTYNTAKIKIDDNEAEEFSYIISSAKNSKEDAGTRLVYEKNGLIYGDHTVKITTTDSTSSYYCIGLDAIDIDSTAVITGDQDTLGESISLNKTSLEMKVEDQDTLIATVLPDETTNKKVQWSSSNTGVVTVDEDGNIVAVGAGSAIVTATTTDGTNLSASCSINVSEAKVNMANLIITMNNGQTKTFNVDMKIVNDFISWYVGRTEGNGSPFYKFDITQTNQPQIKKTDYVIFNNISSFEVDEYQF